MPGPSRRQRILEYVTARVRTIQRRPSGPFDTDIGLNVTLGYVPDMGPDDPDVALAIVVGPDEPGYHGEQVVTKLPIEFHVLAKADIREPWIAIEQVIGDVKRAIEEPDRMLGGLVRWQIRRLSTRTLRREPGSLAVGAVLPYEVTVVEVWGAPEL